MVKEDIIKETFEYSPEGVDRRTLSRQRKATLKVLPEARKVAAVFT